MSGVNARISDLHDEVHDAVRLQCLGLTLGSLLFTMRYVIP